MRLTWIALVAAIFVAVWGVVDLLSPVRTTAADKRMVQGPSKGAGASLNTRPIQGDLGQRPSLAAVRTPGQDPSLPPLNAPLRDHYDALKARAEAGDVRANCRLAFELTRCSRLPHLRRGVAETGPAMDSYVASLLHPIERDRRQRMAEQRVADAQAAVQQLEPICEGTPPQLADGAWRYLLSASESGHLPSMIRFVAMPPMSFGRGEPVASLDGWIAYRTNAGAWLARALEAGEPRAFELAAFIHGRGEWRGLELLPLDGVRSAAFYRALESVASPVYAHTVQANRVFVEQKFKLTPSELGRSQHLADELASQLAHVPKGSVDFTRGTYREDDGSHCER